MTDYATGGLVAPGYLAGEYRSAGGYMPISAGMLKALSFDPPTDAERAAWAVRDAEVAALRDSIKREHKALIDEANGLAHDMLDLHAPHFGQYDVDCHGCSYGGYEGEPPDWPCSTYRMVAERYGRAFVEESHGTRMLGGADHD